MCIMDIMIKLFGVDKKASMIVVLEFKTPIPLQLLKLDIFSMTPSSRNFVSVQSHDWKITSSHAQKWSQLVQNQILFQSIRFTKYKWKENKPCTIILFFTFSIKRFAKCIWKCDEFGLIFTCSFAKTKGKGFL